MRVEASYRDNFTGRRAVQQRRGLTRNLLLEVDSLTPIAAMVAQMLEANVPREAIILAIQTVEQCLLVRGNSADISADVSAERRRNRDRERKRLARVSAEFPQNSAESAEIPHAAISILKEEYSKKEKKNSRATRLSAEWKPSESHYLEGQRSGHDRARVDSFAIDLRLWADANAHRPVARKLDWDKTFSGWMRRQKPGEIPLPNSQPLRPQRRMPEGLTTEQLMKYAVFWNQDTPESAPPEEWHKYSKQVKNGKVRDDREPSLV